jgi:hypothetical protein
MNIYEQIVRELAEREVEVQDVPTNWCVFCGAEKRRSNPDPLEHHPNCLWLRARRAVEFNGSAGVMHARYDQEKGVFPCCGKAPGDVAANDLMTLDPVASPVTCKGPEQ